MVEVINFNMFIDSNYEFALLCINEVDWAPATHWRIHVAYEFTVATNPGSLEVSQSVLALSFCLGFVLSVSQYFPKIWGSWEYFCGAKHFWIR